MGDAPPGAAFLHREHVGLFVRASSPDPGQRRPDPGGGRPSRQLLLLGILALAVGVSLSLALELGRSRIVAAENERKTAELAQARELQLSMLPREYPPPPGSMSRPHRTPRRRSEATTTTSGGGDGSLLIAFGDATGHGLAAGIVVTAAKALFTSLPVRGALPELMAGCDGVFRGMRLPGLQMCFALARVSPREAAVTSAAMPPILVHRCSSGAIEELGAGDLPLGGRIPPRYEERRTDLSPGDTLLFSSDGFAELLGPDGRELGYSGAQAFREAARGSTAREVVDRLGRRGDVPRHPPAGRRHHLCRGPCRGLGTRGPGPPGVRDATLLALRGDPNGD